MPCFHFIFDVCFTFAVYLLYFADVDHRSFNVDNVNTAESTTFDPDHMMEVDKVTEAGSSVDAPDPMTWSGDSLEQNLRLEEVPVLAGGDNSSLQCTSPEEKRQRIDDNTKESPRTSARSSPRPQTGDDHSVSSGKTSSADSSGKSPDHKVKGTVSSTQCCSVILIVLLIQVEQVMIF
jgi:hypothetical protein